MLKYHTDQYCILKLEDIGIYKVEDSKTGQERKESEDMLCMHILIDPKVFQLDNLLMA
jgi:hypothetical protein